MERAVSRRDTSKALKKSRSPRSARAQMIIGVVVVLQLAAAVFFILNGRSDIPKDSESAQALLREAIDAQTKGDPDQAEDAYTAVLEFDPSNKIAQYNLGILLEEKGQSEEAEERYNAALASDPNFVPALFNLAVLKDSAGEPEAAAELYRKIISIDPKMAKARLNLGFILVRKLGQTEEGKRELVEAMALDRSLATRVSPEDLK